MARNIATRKLVEVSGLKQMQQNIAQIVSRVEGAAMQRDLGQLAAKGASMLESNAKAQGWPQDAIKSIFVYSRLDPKESRRRRGPAALFGFRKRGRNQPYAPGYREWTAGNTGAGGHDGSAKEARRRLARVARRTVAAGARKIGESVATMFEFGTAKMAAARPAMRPTIQAMRASYVADVGAILQRILASPAGTQSGSTR